MKGKRADKMTASSKVSKHVTSQKKKGSFFAGVKLEVKKISWTKKGELLKLTRVVLTAIFLFGAGIYLVDLIVKSSLDFLRYLVRAFIG